MFKNLVLISCLLLSACVYRLDIQQGNILAQKDIDKLRPELTKDQVLFVLGSPVIDDGFADGEWTYLYSYRHSNRGETVKKRLVLQFADDKLVSARGDYTIPDALKTSDAKAEKSDNENAQ